MHIVTVIQRLYYTPRWAEQCVVTSAGRLHGILSSYFKSQPKDLLYLGRIITTNYHISHR